MNSTLELRVSAPVLKSTLTQFGYWWSPLDGLNVTSPSGFVAQLAPPALACERLALLTLGAQS